MTAILINSHQLDVRYFQQVPDGLRVVIERVREGRYRELYENNPTSGLSLETALEQVLKWLGECSQNPRLSYFCLAMILGLAVRPTVRCYLPDEQFTRLFFQELFHVFLGQKSGQDLSGHYGSFLGRYQALDEAILVLEGTLLVGDRVQAPSQLLDISEICLEGYAIFPGSLGRRELFDWWLLEAVPAACLWVFPSHIYTIKGLKRRQESLERLRSYFWAVVRQGQGKGVWSQNDSTGSIEGKVTTLVNFIVRANINEDKFFYLGFWILFKAKDNTTVIFNRTGPSPR